MGIFYVHTDHLNAPRLVTQPSNNAQRWRWDRDPFGTTAPNENPQSLGTFSYNLRLPGQFYDSETGLHYNYFRDYDPQVGRYVESDPIGLEGGLNTYAYVDGDPVSLADPTGQCPWCIAAAIGAITGAGMDFGLQLLENGGKIECIDWTQVGVSAATGAALSGLAPTGFLLGRGGTRAAQFGYNRAPGLLNRWETRLGWSGPKNGYDVLSLRSPGVPGKHLDLPGIRVPSGGKPIRDGAVAGATGGAAANAATDPCNKCSAR